jgi:hypothetical protein
MKLEKKWQSVYGRVMVAADLTSLNSLLSLPPDWQLLRIYSPTFFLAGIACCELEEQEESQKDRFHSPVISVAGTGAAAK